MNLPQLWELEFVGDRGEDFSDSEWSFLLGGKLGVWKRAFKMLSLEPYLRSLFEWLEVSPGSTFHGLSGEVMGSKSFFSHGEEGV